MSIISNDRPSINNLTKVMRVGVFCDFREEHWPSMDLVADMLLENLHRNHSHEVTAHRVAPRLRRRFSSMGNANGKLFNADRLLNRFLDYPRFVRGKRSEFDVFHVIDHSYSQLLHKLPAERTVVTCHDLDTFRCLIEPEREPRSIFFKKMMQRTLSGFRKAARVACVSAATRDELMAFDLVPQDRLVVVPNGVHPSFSPLSDSRADAEATTLLGEPTDHQLDLLHVGSTIPRKRINDLLHIFSIVKETLPQARLIRVGGPFTSEQSKLVEKLKLCNSILILPPISTEVLAAVYRRAAVVLQPSEREGFGLPLVEALACGTPVVASDLLVLREVGGNAAEYCPVGNLECWSGNIVRLLNEQLDEPATFGRKEHGFQQAAKFSWAENAAKMVSIYRQIAENQ